jgi:hypothetical protein
MSKSINKLGFWSAILSAAFSLLWFITFNLKDLFGSVPAWHDLEAYAEAFSPLRMLYVYPSLLLALTFIVLMACIYLWSPQDKKIWSLIGLALAIVYSVMASINYNIQAVAVSSNLASGETMGIAMLLPDRPHSVFEALANSYIYMALAMVASGFAFSGSRLKNWIRWIFLAQILTAVGQAGWSMFGLPETVFIVTSMIWVIGSPVSFVLLAVLFKRGQ